MPKNIFQTLHIHSFLFEGVLFLASRLFYIFDFLVYIYIYIFIPESTFVLIEGAKEAIGLLNANLT